MYRFAPLRLGAGDARRIHGTDERIGVANYVEMVRFYIQLMRNVDALTPANVETHAGCGSVTRLPSLTVA